MADEITSVKELPELYGNSFSDDRRCAVILMAILNELRAIRACNADLARQFDRVSAGGNALAVEVGQ